MSLYDRQVAGLVTADLQQLLEDPLAVENVRLEFKSEDVERDEYLKKLSSFANTFGGYLVVGAKADKTGRLQGLPGVDPLPGFKQRVVQWCWDGAYPPVQPVISDPIPSPSDPKKVCYVIFVEESEEAPHFLNSRKGCYVRTDEFSQRFAARLATYEEIQHLSARRRLTVERREALFARSEQRLLSYAIRERRAGPDATNQLGALLKVCIVPRYPSAELKEPAALLRIVDNTVVHWRSMGFPIRAKGIFSQHESVLLFTPTAAFSMLEVNTWGQLYFATEIERANPELGSASPRFLHVYALLGQLLALLAYGRALIESLAYNGTLTVRVRAEHLLGRLLWFSAEHGGPVPGSPLDDVVDFSLDASSGRMATDGVGVARDLVRQLFFAFGLAEVVLDDKVVTELLNHGYVYNDWTLKAPL